MPAPIVSHDQTIHSAPNFNNLYFRNAKVLLTTQLVSCDASDGANVLVTKKVMLHLISVIIALRNAVESLMKPLESYDTDSTPIPEYGQRSHIAPHFCHLYCRNAMVPLTTLLASHNDNTVASVSMTTNAMLHLILIVIYHHWHHITLMPKTMPSHDQRSCCTSFQFHTLRNAVVPLIMLFAAYDTDTIANDIKLFKSHVVPQLSCLDMRNAMVPFWIPLVSCDANTSILTKHIQWCYW